MIIISKNVSVKWISMVFALLMGLSGLLVIGMACSAIKDGEIPQIIPSSDYVEITNRFYEEHKLQDDLGNVVHVKAHETIYVPKNPQRVIVFGGTDLDSFLYLGLQDNVIGRAVMSGNPENVEDAYPIISLDEFNNGGNGVVAVSGTGASEYPHEPNYDIIIDLEPDLIIIEGRQRGGRGSTGHFQRLSAIAPTLDFGLVAGQAIEDNQTNLNDLGTIYDDADVQEAVQRIDNLLYEVNTTASTNNPRTLMILKSGSGEDASYSMHGKDGRWSMVYNEFGLKEAITDLGEATHGSTLTPSIMQEYRDDIDMILIVDQLDENMDTILDHPAFENVPAIEQGRVYQLSGSWYYATGGVTNLLTQLTEVLTSLNSYNQSII